VCDWVTLANWTKIDQLHIRFRKSGFAKFAAQKRGEAVQERKEPSSEFNAEQQEEVSPHPLHQSQ
jgi:hypothetical protein